MKCNNCGSELGANVKFCGQCGSPVPVIEEKEEPKITLESLRRGNRGRSLEDIEENNSNKKEFVVEDKATKKDSGVENSVDKDIGQEDIFEEIEDEFEQIEKEFENLEKEFKEKRKKDDFKDNDEFDDNPKENIFEDDKQFTSSSTTNNNIVKIISIMGMFLLAIFTVKQVFMLIGYFFAF